MPSYMPWSEYKEGLSFEAWMKRIFKTQGDSMAQDIKSLLAEPEKMKQDDEMVVAFSRREGRRRANCHMKPESASVVRLAKPGSQLARFAIRRCWLAKPTDDSVCEVFTRPANTGSVIGPMAWSAILVVRLREPLNDYPESSHDDPERAALSADSVSSLFGCDHDRVLVETVCRDSCAEMVAKQKARLPNRGRGPERLRGGRWQWKAFCESLQRLVAAIFGFVELEASASPSTKFVVGLEPVQPTSSDDIVKARCSCVDGSTFPEWLSTNCRGLDYRPVAPNTYFAEEEAIIHCLVHAAKAQLLTSLQHCQITEADVLIGQKDEEDPSVFQIAARLAAKTNDKGEWDGADKHRVMFVIKKSKLEVLELGRDSAQARYELWHHGHLHFVLSAPRASYACWRMKVAPKLDAAPKLDDGCQEIEPLFGILLSWVGSSFFAHEALRRSPSASVGVLSHLFNSKIGGHEQSNFTEPMPSASSAEPMPSASSEPSDDRRAAHSATVQNLLPSSPGSSSDSSDPGHLLELPPRASDFAASEPRNNNVWKKMMIGAEQDLLKSLLGRRQMSLDEEQAEVMQAILDSDKPLMHVPALAGTGKSVVLGLLMDMMMISDRYVIVLVPSRVLRHETVITHHDGKQAGLAEDVVDERVLWLGRQPTNLKSGNLLTGSGMFADQLEERVTEKLGVLPRLKDIEKELTACKMEIQNAKRQLELQKILPLGQSWCTLADFLPNVHRFKRLLQNHMQLVISGVVNRPLKYVELLSKVKCIVATTDAFLKWKAGQTKGMIGRTVAKVAARSEGVLLDEVEALDVLPAVAALNEHFKTCIFVGDENQKFQRRGAQSPRPFALAIGTAHGAASQVLSQCDDVVVIEETNKAYIPRERGISDWFDKDNDNIENLSGLTLCKRCGPAITSFLSALLAPMKPQLADFKSSDMAPATQLPHNVLWLRVVDLGAVADESFARRARDLLERPIDTRLSSAHLSSRWWHDCYLEHAAGISKKARKC